MSSASRSSRSSPRYLEARPVGEGALRGARAAQPQRPAAARVKAFIDAESRRARPLEGRPRGAQAGCSRPSASCWQLSCARYRGRHRRRGVPARAPRRRARGERALAQEILRRELESPTALGNGVAVPHAIVPGACQAAVLATLAQPLAVPTPGGAPLRLFVVLVCGEGAARAPRAARPGGQARQPQAPPTRCAPPATPRSSSTSSSQIEAGCG